MFPHWFQLRHFLALFFPLLLTQMAQVGTSVFSSIFSGQAGTIDLAGVAVAVNIWYPVFAGLCGIFFGISPIITQLRGAQKTEEIPTYIMQSLYLSLGFTAVIFLAGAFCCRPSLTSWASTHRSATSPGNTSRPWPWGWSPSACRRRCATSSTPTARPTFPWPS